MSIFETEHCAGYQILAHELYFECVFFTKADKGGR